MTAAMISDSVYRRRFLTAMAWPVASSELCDLAGLTPASDEVVQEEQRDSIERMSALASHPIVVAHLLAVSRDLAALLDDTDDPEATLVWLATFAMAATLLLEDLGIVQVR